MDAIRLAWVPPEKARHPVAISYRTAPNAKRSLRASASFPSSCSGAMYWKVPTIAPSAVSGVVIVGEAVSVEGTADVPTVLARPKSSSLAPDFVIMMLPGFRSR
jgi:hypothetical protein